MDSNNLESITKNNFWQVIHDNQKGKFYRTKLTLLDEYFLINETIHLYDLSSLALKHLALFVINKSENTPINSTQNRPRLWQRSPTQHQTDQEATSAPEIPIQNKKRAQPRKRWRKLE
jgi:hypothetical protein